MAVLMVLLRRWVRIVDGTSAATVFREDEHVVQKLLQAKLVPCVGGALTSLVKRLLSTNQTTRPTATTCLRKRVFKRGFAMSRQPFGEALGEVEPGDVQEVNADHLLEGSGDSCDSGQSSESDGNDGEDGSNGHQKKSSSLSSPSDATQRRKRQKRRRATRR